MKDEEYLAFVVYLDPVGFKSKTIVKPDLYYEKSLRHAMRQSLRQGKPLSQGVASCRNGSSQKLSQVQLLRQPSCEFHSGKWRRKKVEDGDMSNSKWDISFPLRFWSLRFPICRHVTMDTTDLSCASFSPSETYDSGEESNDDSQVDLFARSSNATAMTADTAEEMFVEEVKRYRCLWDVASPVYKDKWVSSLK